MLALLYTIMIKHGYSSQLFDLIVFSPLVKNKRSSLPDSNNNRAIALSSCFGKLLDYIIIDFFNDVLLSDDHQFAYKTGHSTTLSSFIVMETIQYYLILKVGCSKGVQCK